MQVLGIGDIENTEREVHCPSGGFTSYRFLLEADGMGFGLHKTVIPPGPPQRWHYKHHKEACYCVSGRAILTNETTGERFLIYPDICYALNNHDPHTLQAEVETVLISVFNPPCKGQEVHQEDGAYAV